MRRTILVTVLVTVALLAIVGGVGYWIFNNYYYYSTDDAQITGPIVPISVPAAGQLVDLPVKAGDTVTAGERVATIKMATTTTTTTATGASSATPAKTIDLTSPINGTVLQIPAIQGQNVTPGTSLLQVTDLKSLNVTAYVDENAINNVKVGQTVDIKVDAYNSTSYSGHVSQIVQATAGQFSLIPTQDNASGNFTKVAQRIPVIITLDNLSGNDLVPGLSATVTIHVH